jgi:hypothetical protein
MSTTTAARPPAPGPGNTANSQWPSEGIVLRLQADLRWLEACERNWTGQRGQS